MSGSHTLLRSFLIPCRVLFVGQQTDKKAAELKRQKSLSGERPHADALLILTLAPMLAISTLGGGIEPTGIRIFLLVFLIR